jgi:YVTN family beta-propeller protein
MIKRVRLASWLFLLAALVLSSLSAQTFVNYEGKQTAPIRLSPDGSRLFAVNTPDNRLSVFDVSNPLNPILIAEIPVGVEPVSVNPLNNDEAWVINEVSDSVSIVSVSQHIVTDTLYVKDEPADVVFANGRAFVSAARKNEIAVFDVATHSSVTNIPVFGENPRSLCVNSNGTRVYAAFALSGNRTTIIPFNQAPPQPSPNNTNLPAAPQVGLIVDAADPNWTNIVKYAMPDNDIVEIDTATLAILRYFPRVGTVNFAIAARPGSGDLYVANTDARNLTRFEPVVRGGFVTNQVSRVNITDGTVTRFDLNTNFAYTNFPNLANQSNALAQPTAIAFGPSGANFFITAFGSDRVALVDANNGNVIARIEINPDAPGSVANPRTKRGPRGLALKPGAGLYVANRISNTLTVIDPFTRAVIREIPIGSHNPTPLAIRQGRGFLYDAKLSGAGLVSCASCHIDAEMDLIAWDLGDPNGTMGTNKTIVSPAFPFFSTNEPVHPMKGPMTTQTLRGLNGIDPLHWRGDRTNFLHFNGAFGSLLGGSVLSAADMAAYRDFINTIVFPPNPNQNLDRTYPTNFAGGNAVAGRNTFFNEQYQPSLQLACTTCHTGPPGPGSDKQIIDRNALQESQDFKVPHLRNVYQKLNVNFSPGAQSVGGFGIIHDGTDPSLLVFLSRSVFGSFATDATRKANLNAFVQCFDTGTAPAVGYTRTIDSTNVTSASISNDWSLLEAQAAATNIDLIIKLSRLGVRHGYVYQPVSNNYRPDSQSLPLRTRSELWGTIVNAGVATIMGVPPGAGTRLGIDRNLDGVLDGDVQPPSLRIARASNNSLVAWSTNASGFVLETSPALPATNWVTETSVRGTAAGEYNVTNAPSPATRFFRLKEL